MDHRILKDTDAKFVKTQVQEWSIKEVPDNIMELTSVQKGFFESLFA